MRVTLAEELQEVRRLTTSGEARALRISARLSQADIARSIDTDPSTVARWETGDRLPRGELACRYLRLLNRLSKAAAA